MVAREYDDGVVDKASILESLQEFADVAVDIAACAEVGTACIADFIHRQRFVPQVINFQ
ncbi:hypothetical protein D3C84_1073420 [compost metagenome]